QRTGDYLARMDADGDGRVSLPEYQDWMGYAFDGMDRDRDGVLSPAEQPGGKSQPLTREQHRARLAERFRKRDRSHNGFLDAKELPAPRLCPRGSDAVGRSAPDRRDCQPAQVSVKLAALPPTRYATARLRYNVGG